MSGRDLDVYLTQNVLADSCSRIDVRKGKTYLNRFVARIMDHECQYIQEQEKILQNPKEKSGSSLVEV